MNSCAAVKKTPFISIITVCLNEPNLERTCESIVNQTFQDFEWIVIDGGSNAATLAVFEKYKSRIDFFVSEPDGGIFDAMNKGGRLARGEWINFMNAGDCFINSEILSALFSPEQHEVDCGVVYGDHVVNDSDVLVQAPHTNKSDMYLKTICQQAAFIHRSVLEKYAFDECFKICADWDLWYRLFIGGVRFVKLETTITRFYENGASHRDQKAFFEELSRVRAKYYSPAEIAKLKKEQALLLRKRLGNV